MWERPTRRHFNVGAVVGSCRPDRCENGIHVGLLVGGFLRAISFGWVCHSRVELLTSAKSNVTVPVGSPLTPSSLHSTSGASARGSIWLMLASMRRPHGPKHQRKRVEHPCPPRIFALMRHRSVR